MDKAELAAEMAKALPKMTFRGVPVAYSPRLDEDFTTPYIFAREDTIICATLRNHFTKRIWPPYTVRVWYDRLGFVVNIGDGDWDHGAIYRFCLHRDEIGPGAFVDSVGAAASRLDCRFDDGFARLREIVANGNLETGVHA